MATLGVAGAQGASPWVGTPGAGTPVVDASGAGECRVEPRTVDELRRLNVDAVFAAQTAVALGAEEAIAAGFFPSNADAPVPEPPPGPVPAEAVAGIEATRREAAACAAANDRGRSLALVSDAFWVRNLTLIGPFEEEALAGLLSPGGATGEAPRPFVPVAAADVRPLPDGRVGVLGPAPATRPLGSPPPTNRVLEVYARVGDRYLYDDLLFVLAAGATPVAAPVPSADRQPTPVPAGATPTVTARATLIVLADVGLRREAGVDAPVVGALPAGLVVEATGRIEEADGETWWGVTRRDGGASGFVPSRLLTAAINEMRVSGSGSGTGRPAPSVTPVDAVATAQDAGQALRGGPQPTELEPTGGSVNLKLDADRVLAADPLLAGNATGREGALDGLRPSLEGFAAAGCRMGLVLISGFGSDEADGMALAEAVALLLPGAYPELFAYATVETSGFADPALRGEVDLRYRLFYGCPLDGGSGAPTPVVQRVVGPVAASPAAATPAADGGLALWGAIAERLGALRAGSDAVTGWTTSSSSTVDGDGLLAGDPEAERETRFFVGGPLDRYDAGGCRVAYAAVAAHGRDEADGRAIAEAVAALVREEGGPLLAGAPVEAVGVPRGERGRVAYQIVLAAGCAPSEPTPAVPPGGGVPPTATPLAGGVAGVVSGTGVIGAGAAEAVALPPSRRASGHVVLAEGANR